MNRFTLLLTACVASLFSPPRSSLPELGAAPLPAKRAPKPAKPLPPVPLWAVTRMQLGGTVYLVTFHGDGTWESVLPGGASPYAGEWKLEGRRLTTGESPVGCWPAPGGQHSLRWSADLDAELAGRAVPGSTAVRLLMK